MPHVFSISDLENVMDGTFMDIEDIEHWEEIERFLARYYNTIFSDDSELNEIAILATGELSAKLNQLMYENEAQGEAIDRAKKMYHATW